MKTRTSIAAIALTAAAAVGTAGVAAAQSDDPPTPAAGARADFVCANLGQIQQVQGDHATLLTDRLALLETAKAAAEAGGDTKAVERIEARTATVTERQAKVSARQEKLTTFAADHC